MDIRRKWKREWDGIYKCMREILCGISRDTKDDLSHEVYLGIIV